MGQRPMDKCSDKISAVSAKSGTFENNGNRFYRNIYRAYSAQQISHFTSPWATPKAIDTALSALNSMFRTIVGFTRGLGSTPFQGFVPRHTCGSPQPA